MPAGCAVVTGVHFVFVGTPTTGRVVLECPDNPNDTSAFPKSTLRSWDLSDPRSTPQWQLSLLMPVVPGFNIPYIVASSDGSILGVMGPAGAQIVDGKTGRLVATGPAPGGDQMERLALSPDSRTLATIVYSGHVQLLDTATGKLVHTLTSSTGSQGLLGFAGDPEFAFSPDGNYFAVWTNPLGLEVWDLHTGASVGVLDGRANTPPFSSSLGNFFGYDEGPYSQLVVTFGATDNSVTVSAERRLGAPPNPLTAYLGGGDSAVRTVTWSLKLSDWKLAACTIVGRDLTAAEWNMYIGAAVPYHHTCTPLLSDTHHP